VFLEVDNTKKEKYRGRRHRRWPDGDREKDS